MCEQLLPTMSKRELDRHEVITRVTRREITGKHAAELLKLSTRQVWRLKAREISAGPRGLIHQSRGRPSNHRIPDQEHSRIVSLLTNHYGDFGPTLAGEKLAERHGIVRDPKTVRAIMIAEGLWKTNVRRKTEYHSWRQRRSCLGEMIQFDGSYEDWFEDRGPRCCLLAAIDDASGRVVKAVFGPHEGVFPVFAFWKEYMRTCGVPRSIYLDRFSTYKMTQKVAVENHDLKTQFERAMTELQCQPIFAHSPQAKGRIERLFGTLQDRLIKEMRLAKIRTIDEGNRYLEGTYLPAFNRKFSVAPAAAANLHRPLTIGERTRLDAVFSRQEERTVRNDFTLSFENTWYQLVSSQPVTICKGDRVIVEERLDGSIRFRIRRKYLNTTVLPERPRRSADIPWVLAATAPAAS